MSRDVKDVLENRIEGSVDVEGLLHISFEWAYLTYDDPRNELTLENKVPCIFSPNSDLNAVHFDDADVAFSMANVRHLFGSNVRAEGRARVKASVEWREDGRAYFTDIESIKVLPRPKPRMGPIPTPTAGPDA